jgi:hypothetical protein
MRMEIAIDELITDTKESIDRVIPKVGYPMLKRSVVTEIKKLWKEKIDQWKVDQNLIYNFMKKFKEFIQEDFNNWDNDKPITGWNYGDDKISDIYKRDKYPENNPLSHKAHSFLVNWSWNDRFLKYYQNNGIKEIDPEIIEELSKYKPKKEVTLYRVIFDLKGELKYSKNKLKSYCKNLDAALMMADNPSYIEIREYKPEKILVDTTLIPNYRDLDLIEEVICITGK